MYDPDKTLLEQSFFGGGPATPEKIRDLQAAIRVHAGCPSTMAFLSGCAMAFLMDFAKMLEEEERSFDAVKVTNAKIVEEIRKPSHTNFSDPEAL